jgi:hypothetical protein
MIPQEQLAEVLWHPAVFDRLVVIHGADAVLRQTRDEGIAPYLAYRLPESALLADTRRAAVLDEALRHPVMCAVCDALGRAGLAPLILKGGAWAHTTYPKPWCRPRMDLDLLVARRDRARAFDVLRSEGFTPSGRIPGEHVNHQEAFVRTLAPGITFTVDLHWQVFNRSVVATALPQDTLAARSRPAPFAGVYARQADPVDNLILACLHPVVHHVDRMRLVWWLDVALLADALPETELDELRDRASAAGVAGLVAYALAQARRRSAGPDCRTPAFAPDFQRQLQQAGAHDVSLELLNPNRDQLIDAWEDIRALPTTRARLALAREHLLPPAEFMYASYGTRQRWLLPVLHARRLVTGSVMWVWAWITNRRDAG